MSTSTVGGNGTVGGYYVGESCIAGTPIQEHLGDFSESISLSGVKVVLVGHTVSDGFSVSETFSKVGTFVRKLSDNISLTEAFSKIGSFVRKLSDDIGLTEAFSKVGSFVKKLSDSIGLTDTIGSIKDFIRGFVESITSSDSTRKKTSKGTKTENIGLSDSYSIVQVLLKFFTDTVSMLENFATDLDKFFSRLFTEQINVQDSWSRILDKIVNFSETVGVADIVSKVLPSLNWSESISVEDRTLKKLFRSFIESIGLIDVFEKAASFIKSFTESIELTEHWIINILKNFIEDIAESEVFHITQTLFRTLTDSLQVVDTIGKKTITSLSEAITLADSYLKMAIKGLVENITLTDSITRAITIVRKTVVAVEDFIKRRLNGILILWERTRRLVGEWIAREKNSGEYSTIDKNTTEEWTKLKDENDE